MVEEKTGKKETVGSVAAGRGETGRGDGLVGMGFNLTTDELLKFVC